MIKGKPKNDLQNSCHVYIDNRYVSIVVVVCYNQGIRSRLIIPRSTSPTYHVFTRLLCVQNHRIGETIFFRTFDGVGSTNQLTILTQHTTRLSFVFHLQYFVDSVVTGNKKQQQISYCTNRHDFVLDCQRSCENSYQIAVVKQIFATNRSCYLKTCLSRLIYQV